MNSILLNIINAYYSLTKNEKIIFISLISIYMFFATFYNIKIESIIFPFFISSMFISLISIIVCLSDLDTVKHAKEKIIKNRKTLDNIKLTFMQLLLLKVYFVIIFSIILLIISLLKFSLINNLIFINILIFDILIIDSIFFLLYNKKIFIIK